MLPCTHPDGRGGVSNRRSGDIVSKISSSKPEKLITIMSLQRACGAERQVRNRLPNRALRAQSNVLCTEYSATLQADIICRGCWYPAKGTASAVKHGGTADPVFLFVPDRAGVLSGTIFSPLAEMPGEYFYGGIHDGLKGTLFGKKQRGTQKE